MPTMLTTEKEETRRPDTEEESRRISRINMSLPMRVEGKDDPTAKWDEITRLKDISPFGAGFTLTRPVKRGRLVQLTMPMPRRMRCYDYMEPQYRVWGIVRRCVTVSDSRDDEYYIGVAFIGKTPPKSYFDNPAQLYDITHRVEDGLWQITKAAPIPDETNVPKEDRRHSRYAIPVNLIINLLDDAGRIIQSEPTVSENISLGGASVFTSLDIDEGTHLVVTSAQYDVSIKAIVRGRRMGIDGIPRLHIEFIDRYFPLEGIEL